MPLQLACPYTGCDFKTEQFPDDAATAAVELLKLHTTAVHPAVAPAKQEKAKLPLLVVTDGMVTEASLGMFKQQLVSYKRLAALISTSADTVLQGLPPTAYQQLYARFGASLTEQTEEDVLKNIENLLVRPENKLSHVLKLQRMKQDSGQTVATFSTNIRAAARQCDFKVQCPCNNTVSFEDNMVLYQLLSGLEDTDVQADLLAETELTLERAEKYARDKEMAKRSQECMTASSVEEMNRIRSSYKKRQPFFPTLAKKCNHCGADAHVHRETECKAFNNTCPCGKKGHFVEQCYNKGRQKKGGAHRERSAAIAESIFTINPIGKHNKRIVVRSITYDKHSKKWISQQPLNRSKLPVRLTLNTDSMEQFKTKHKLVPGLETYVDDTTADTGASVVCSGPEILSNLMITNGHLIKTSVQLYAANQKRLTVLGCLPFDITIKDNEKRKSLEMVYIVKELKGLYLSRRALVSLDCIPPSFPFPPVMDEKVTTFQTDTSQLSDSEQLCAMGNLCCEETVSSDLAPCGCPKRADTPDPPTPPVEFTEGNIPILQEFLLQHYASSTFNTCCHQPLPLMHGPPLEIHIKPDAVPAAVYTPAIVAAHYEVGVKRDLQRDVEMGVIEKVDVNEPVTWCSRMVITRKHNGEPRRTIDLKELNKVSVRQTHPTMPPFQQAMTIPKEQWKSTTDAFNGYHSVLIRESDRHLTTFLSPWGRYRYRTAAQGSKVSGDAFTHRFDKITVNVEDYKRQIDDSILFKPTISDMYWHMAEYLTLCGRNGILQNPEKFVFCKKTVDWAGFRIGPDNVNPLPKHTESVRTFPTPQNITDMRSFMALVNQVSSFYATQPKLLPFRNLLKKDSKWYWDEALDHLFAETKELIATKIEQGIKTFEINRPTAVLTDWCKSGLGYVLTQKYCTCSELTSLCCSDGWKVCGVGSRFTNQAESRYSPTEGEALAVVNGLIKTKYFTLGSDNLIVGTDHKPLLGLLNDRCLDSIDNPRLRRLKEKTFGWNFEIEHIPSHRHGGPDALSRYGVRQNKHELETQLETTPNVDSVNVISDIHRFCDNLQGGCKDCRETTTMLMAIEPDDGDMLFDDEICAVSTCLLPVDWETLKKSSKEDPTTVQLIDMVKKDSFPTTADKMDPSLRTYWRIRHDLDVTGHILTYKARPVIPADLRHRVLNVLHSAHQGVTGMKLRAERSLFWPGLSSAIEETRARCNTCNKNAPSNPNMPPITPINPEYPFQHICADYFNHHNHSFGIIVDRYSNWFQIYEGELGSITITSVLTSLCRDFGVPETVTSDGGPQFTGKLFQDFLAQHGISHRLSSVAFPHANCRAEVAVKTAKRMIQDNVGEAGKLDSVKLTRALLTYRNTPDRATGMSPAEMLLGRQLRDFLPGNPVSAPPLRSCNDLRQAWKDVAEWREWALCKRSSKIQERLTAHTKDLPPLQVGQHVLVQNQVGNHPRKWDKRGIIIDVLPYRQYKVRLDGSRRLTLRNRKFLRTFVPVLPANITPQTIHRPSKAAFPDVPHSAPSNRSVMPRSNIQQATRFIPAPAPTHNIEDHQGHHLTPPRTDTTSMSGPAAPLLPPAIMESQTATPVHITPSPASPFVPSPIQQDSGSGSPLAARETSSEGDAVRRSTRKGRGQTSKYEDYN